MAERITKVRLGEQTGPETADKNVGYVDGALRSGERAANEVAALL